MQGYRSDIDGLRTVAVLSVLLFHAKISGFSGGYTGVDVFFVISGFLITQKIENEIREGRFTFAGFYFGRARRLLPALFTTIATTLLFAALLFAPDHLQRLGESTIWAAIPFSNVYFYFTSGYWDIYNLFKPLLHTWSLSVEEQFYFVWPLALFALAKFRSWAAPAALAVAGFLSFIAALVFIDHIAATFFLPWFRVFEFALGALLVWLPRRDTICEPLAIIGLFAVLWSVFNFEEKAPTALMIVPSLGAAMLIYAGPVLIARLWNNPIGVYLGQISYSIYLVHWPVIVFYSYWRYDPIDETEQWTLVAVSILLAMPLHHFVEQRFRYAPKEKRRSVPWVIAAASAALVLVGWNAAAHGWQWRTPADPEIIAEFYQPECKNGVGICNTPHPDAVIAGDSHAAAWRPAIAKMLKDLKLNGTFYPIQESCPMVLGIYAAYTATEKNPCPAKKQEWLARIEKDNPKILILPGFWENGLGNGFGARYTTGHAPANIDVPEARELFAQAMRATIAQLTQSRKVVILAGGPIVEQTPSGCFDRPKIFPRYDCANRNVLTDPSASAFIRETLHSIASDFRERMFYFDGFSYLCNTSTHCALGDDGRSFYADRHHISRYGGLWLEKHAFGDLEEFVKPSE